MKIAILVTIFLFQLTFGFGQKLIPDIQFDGANHEILDSVLTIQKRVSEFLEDKVSIYEFGDSIVDCNTNFRNLLNNWNKEFVSNADDYKFLECSLIDTISDSTIYDSYKYYFSSDEPLFCRLVSRTRNYNGRETSELYIYPGYKNPYFYDTRGLPEETRSILSDSFLEEVQHLLKKPFDVDTMELNSYFFFSYRKDTTITTDSFFSSGSSESSSTRTIITQDSLTQDYYDIFIDNKRQIGEVDLLKARKLIVQDIMIQRIRDQLYFIQKVNIGDVVYQIKFEYDGIPYSNYVICSSTTNQVLMDNFFQGIKVSRKEKQNSLFIDYRADDQIHGSVFNSAIHIKINNSI